MQKYASLQQAIPFTRVGSNQTDQGVSCGEKVARHLETLFIDDRARSSAVEHSVHIGGVTGSNPVVPTIPEPPPLRPDGCRQLLSLGN